MYASMPCQISLITECLITLITSIWTLTSMYLTGISAFSTVYLQLFIQSNLVKTQSLKIRIYADRKIIFIAMYTLYKNPLYLKYCVIYKSVLDD